MLYDLTSFLESLALPYHFEPNFHTPNSSLFRVVEENILFETDMSGPLYLFRIVSLLLKKLTLIFLFRANMGPSMSIKMSSFLFCRE